MKIYDLTITADFDLSSESIEDIDLLTDKSVVTNYCFHQTEMFVLRLLNNVQDERVLFLLQHA